MVELPRGTVTLVFTDIEGSTRLLAALGSRYEEVLAIHRRLLRAAFSSNAGIEVDTQGDALFYAFSRAQDAVRGGVAGQRALASHDFGEGVELRVRMGIHTGEPSLSDEGYVGTDVHLGARISAVAWGGQIVVSFATAALVGGKSDGISLRSLGQHALKDIEDRVELHQVVAPGLRENFPALRSVSSHPTNVPARLPTLIGREEEIAALVELLSSEDISVVTLVGPGGTGKTRLALAVGAELPSVFGDGVFFVDLSALSDASLVVPAIAQALSLREAAGRSLTETLENYLSSKEMVLILDNFEQVMEAASEVSALVASSSSLKVVVTSREALRIEGEREFPLHPLALPSLDSEPTEILASPAVELFVARARAVRPGLALSGEDAVHVATICRRLDGLPLAIELAAARVKVLSVGALAARLEKSLGVLGTGRRDASDRQRTLIGAIAWSYELLDEAEQRLFRRLGVFAGGWSLDTAEEVCDQGDLSLDLLDGLVSLVDKSLARALEGDEDRFSMLETVREFSLEKLGESGEAQEIRSAHAEYFRALAEEAEPHLVGADQKVWLDRLEREHENLRAAMSWSFAGNTDSAIRIAAAARRLWWVRGYLSEGQAWLRRALGAAPDGSSMKVRILRGLTVIVQMQGDNNEAESLARQGLALSKSMTDDEGTISFLITLGLVAEERRDYDGAEACVSGSHRSGTETGHHIRISEADQ
jgi:predicted ATPase/class 3 adenylate cyclase